MLNLALVLSSGALYAQFPGDPCRDDFAPSCDQDTLVYCDGGEVVWLACDLYVDEAGDYYASGLTCGAIDCVAEHPADCASLAIPQCVAQVDSGCTYYGEHFFGEDSNPRFCDAGLSCVGEFQYRSNAVGELELYYGDTCRSTVGSCGSDDDAAVCSGNIARRCQELSAPHVDGMGVTGMVADMVGIDCATLGTDCRERLGESFCQMLPGEFCDGDLFQCLDGAVCEGGICVLDTSSEPDVDPEDQEDDNDTENSDENPTENPAENNVDDEEAADDDENEVPVGDDEDDSSEPDSQDSEDVVDDGEETGDASGRGAGIVISPVEPGDHGEATRTPDSGERVLERVESYEDRREDNVYSDRPSQVRAVTRADRQGGSLDTATCATHSTSSLSGLLGCLLLWSRMLGNKCRRASLAVYMTDV